MPRLLGVICNFFHQCICRSRFLCYFHVDIFLLQFKISFWVCTKTIRLVIYFIFLLSLFFFCCPYTVLLCCPFSIIFSCHFCGTFPFFLSFIHSFPVLFYFCCILVFFLLCSVCSFLNFFLLSSFLFSRSNPSSMVPIYLFLLLSVLNTNF